MDGDLSGGFFALFFREKNAFFFRKAAAECGKECDFGLTTYKSLTTLTYIVVRPLNTFRWVFLAGKGQFPGPGSHFHLFWSFLSGKSRANMEIFISSRKKKLFTRGELAPTGN